MPYPEADDILLSACLQLIGVVVVAIGLIGTAVYFLW
jgi:hypothetical protein